MEIIILLGVALLSLIIILSSSHYIIFAISRYAKKTGISDYLVGFFIVSIGTAIPELSTASISSWLGNGQLGLGDVIGANTLDVTLVLGAILLVARTIKVKNKLIKETILTIFLMALLPLLLGIDGNLSRIDGIILLVAFLIYSTSLLVEEGKLGKLKRDVKMKFIVKEMCIFLFALAALLLATRWLVWSVIQFSNIFIIPVFLMGAVFLATATILPELTVGIKSIIKKSTGLAFGSTFGSVIVNSTFVLGIAAIIRPIYFDLTVFVLSSIVMLFCIAVSYFVIKKEVLTWKHGIFLITLYLLFIGVQLVIG